MKIELTEKQLRAVLFTLTLAERYKAPQFIQDSMPKNYEADYEGVFDYLDKVYHDAGFCVKPTCDKHPKK